MWGGDRTLSVCDIGVGLLGLIFKSANHSNLIKLRSARTTCLSASSNLLEFGNFVCFPIKEFHTEQDSSDLMV